MGDSFQSIVDPVATEAEAPILAERILAGLVAEQIVVPEPSDCVLGRGYAPGRLHENAMRTRYEPLLQLQTNGLEIISKRTVFHNGGLGFELVCHSCGSRCEPPHPSWGDAVGEWYDPAGAPNDRPEDRG
jgi:hypothetical protein